MTGVNEMNERTRHERTGDHLAALLIAVYRLPLESRKIVLEQYEKNLNNIARSKMSKSELCPTCDGNGELLVDGVVDPSEPWLRAPVDTETCPDCNGTGKNEGEAD